VIEKALGDVFLPIHHNDASVVYEYAFLACSVTPIGIALSNMSMTCARMCGK
jgi:hypothetical protein